MSMYGALLFNHTLILKLTEKGLIKTNANTLNTSILEIP